MLVLFNFFFQICHFTFFNSKKNKKNTQLKLLLNMNNECLIYESRDSMGLIWGL